MSATGAETVDGYEHARARNQATSDGIAQADVDQVFASDVSDRGEASFQHFPRVYGRSNRPFRQFTAKLIDESLFPVVAVFSRQVSVGIDEARRKSRVAEVDNHGSGGYRNTCSQSGDLGSLDQDCAVAYERV